MDCGLLAFAVILSTVCVIDYKIYKIGGNSWFFEDKTEIEKLNREIALIEARKKLEELKSEEHKSTNLGAIDERN